MNFLAHFHLAWPDEGLVTGALEGDYLKGPLRGQRVMAVEAGIRLHRRIDAYTDSHPRVAELRREFPADLRRYAGIVIDLGFDYCLTRHWHSYCDIPLNQFAQSVYSILECNRDHLSDSAQMMLTRMRQYDILCAYDQWNAVTGSAQRVGERFKRGNPLTGAADLNYLQRPLEQAFHQFYPDLIQNVQHAQG